MPPELALILCILFILYVFWHDFKQKPNVTTALWVPLIWMMIVSSRYVSHWLNIGTASISPLDYEDGSPIDRLVFLLLLAFGIFILSKRKAKVSQILKNNKWIFVWFLYCGISIAWSDFPLVALKRWIKGIGTVVMVLIVLTEPDPVESLKTLVRRCSYVLLPLSILFIKYFRNLGVSYNEWTGSTIYAGVADGKNTLGRLCLVSALFTFWAIVTMWQNKDRSLDRIEFGVNVLFLFISLWLLRLADSATSIATLFIGFLIFIGLGLPVIRMNIAKSGIFVFAIFLVLFVLQQSFNFTELFVTNLGRNMTFTDRIFLWKDLLRMDTNPIFGSGYDSFWLGSRLESIWEKYYWHPNEAHSGYLEIYLELGLVGLAFFMGIILVIYRKIRRTLIYDFEVGRLQMTFLVIFLLYNITESAIKGMALMWFIFLLIAASVYRPQRLESTGSGP